MDQAIVRGSELLKQGLLDQAQRAFTTLELDPENTTVLALLDLSYFRACAPARTSSPRREA